MVEQKIVQYSDNVIIECINESEARIILPKSYLDSIYGNKNNSYYDNPLKLIHIRLEKDFNFKVHNKGTSYIHLYNDNTKIEFIIRRKIIPIK